MFVQFLESRGNFVRSIITRSNDYGAVLMIFGKPEGRAVIVGYTISSVFSLRTKGREYKDGVILGRAVLINRTNLTESRLKFNL